MKALQDIEQQVFHEVNINPFARRNHFEVVEILGLAYWHNEERNLLDPIEDRI